MRRKLLISIVVIFSLLLLAFIFRNPILRSCATLLMHEDALQKADAIFILSGGSLDRGNEAVKLFNAGYSTKLICTGGNAVGELQVFNMDTLESDMTVANLRKQNVPDSCIIQIKYGTSTREEADCILNYCKAAGLKKVIILSSKLHTGRAYAVFKEKFEGSNVEVILHGAPSSRFNELQWWHREEGLIAVNNEWLKTFYYWWKY